MFAYVWPPILAVLAVAHVALRSRCERDARQGPGAQRPLEDLVREATEYDVAYLHHGPGYTVALAFRRLLSSGYLRAVGVPRQPDGPQYRYVAEPDVDPGPLLPVERDVLGAFETEAEMALDARWEKAGSLRACRAWLEERGLLVVATDRPRVPYTGRSLLVAGASFARFASLGLGAWGTVLATALFLGGALTCLGFLGPRVPREPLFWSRLRCQHFLTRRGSRFVRRYRACHGALPKLDGDEAVEAALRRISSCSV